MDNNYMLSLQIGGLVLQLQIWSSEAESLAWGPYDPKGQRKRSG